MKISEFLQGRSVARQAVTRYINRHDEIFKNHDFWGGHLWSHSYYMSTLGNMSKEVVEQYIRNQYTK